MPNDNAPQPVPKTPAPKHRVTYLRTTCGSISRPSGPENATADAKELVRRCLKPLGHGKRIPTRFPPKLFILWITPAFLPQLDELLAALHEELEVRKCKNVPLIGASVAACVFANETDGVRRLQVAEEGAALICLASRFLKAKVVVGERAQDNPDAVSREVLQKLKVIPSLDLTGRSNRFLLTFLPGYDSKADPTTYRAAEIMAAISNETHGSLHMFGGVASLGLQGGQGIQIVNKRHYTRALAAALITTDLTYAICICQGLKECEGTTSYRVLDLDETGRRIRAFESLAETPLDVLDRLTPPWILGEERQPDESSVILPHPALEGTGIHLQRPITKGSSLKALRPDDDKLRAQLDKFKSYVKRLHAISDSLIVGALGICSALRYYNRHNLDWNFNAAMDLVRERYPTTVYVGCLMDGEVGIDSLGRPTMSNWSLSEALLIDHVPGQTQLYKVARILAERQSDNAIPQTVEEASSWILKRIRRTGYPGGMISLLLQDSDEERIVALDAIGRRWPIIKHLTQRSRHGNDVLAKVLNENKPYYVQNAFEDPFTEQQARRAGRILSYYSLPLRDDQNSPIGVLQIDLGDVRHLRNLSSDVAAALDAFGRLASDMLTRAMQLEEVRLARGLDEILFQYQKCWKTIREAVGQFIEKAADVLQVNAHARLYNPENQSLELVGGRGDYYLAAKEARWVLDIDRESPSAFAFNSQSPLISNNTADDELFQRMNQEIAGGKLAGLHAQIGAYAILPIQPSGGSPVGIFACHSQYPWCFTKARVRLLENLTQRLSEVISYVEQKQKEDRILTFLRDIMPPLDGSVNIHAALRDQAERARRAAGADTFSCYLWDNERNRFVLRAQHGWCESGWVHAAWFGREDGLAGTLAPSNRPIHIPDLFKYFLDHNLDGEKYLRNMFGESLKEGETYEVLALPLNFKTHVLGIILFHRRKSPKSQRGASGFPSIDEKVLQEAYEALSATIFALQKHDFARWHDLETMRLDAVGKTLLQHENKTQRQLIDAFCHQVVDSTIGYGFYYCTVYLMKPDGTSLTRVGDAHQTKLLNESSYCNDVPYVDDLVTNCVATGVIREERHTGAPQHVASEVSQELLVRRVCLPLLEDGFVVGVLDLRGTGSRETEDYRPLPRYSIEDLVGLADRLTLALKMNRLAQEAFWATQVVEGAGAYLLQQQHDLTGATWSMSEELEKLKASHGLPEELKSGFSQLEKPVHRIRRIMDVAKDWVAWSGTSLQVCRLDLLIQDTIQEYAAQARAVGIRFYFDWLQVAMNGFPNLLHEVFRNPVHNSILALGNPTFVGKKEIQIRMERRGHECYVEIKDTGPGIPLQIWKAIEEGRKPSSAWRGSGSGLIIARMFCKRHQGDFAVLPPSRAGTTVIINLPVL